MELLRLCNYVCKTVFTSPKTRELVVCADVKEA